MTNPLKSYKLEQAEPTFRGTKEAHVAYLNSTMNEDAKRRGLQWMIAGNGDVYLGFTFAATRQHLKADQERQEAERTDWKRAFGMVVEG